MKKTVVIKTKKWCRQSFRNENGCCCALGFAGKQLHDDYEYFNLSRKEINNNIVKKIIEANDDLRGQERRTELKKLFKKAGLRLLFK